MRKIEREMIQAIIERKDWHKANTSVEVHESPDIPTRKTMHIKLHGHTIGQYDDDGTLFGNHQGWTTVTTKSRLNSLINFAVDPTRNGIHQKNFEWYITRDGVVYNMPQGWHQV